MTKKTERGAEATPCVNGSTVRKNTQEETVLEHMRRYGSITSMTAFERYSITRLAAKIFVLRKAGYDIDMVWETSQYGTRYGRYILREDVA